MQKEERIKKLKNYIEERKRLKLDQKKDSSIDTIHFFDIGDLERISYTLEWVLGDDNTDFLGVANV